MRGEVSRSGQQLARYLYYLGRIRAVQLEYSEAKDCLQQASRKARPSSMPVLSSFLLRRTDGAAWHAGVNGLLMHQASGKAALSLSAIFPFAPHAQELRINCSKSASHDGCRNLVQQPGVYCAAPGRSKDVALWSALLSFQVT